MKKVIIIGASSGIGQKIALTYAKRGYRLGLAARRTEPLADIKQQYPDRVEYMSIDVTQDDAQKKLYQLIELIDGMDLLVYCAGVGWYNPQLDSTRELNTVRVNCLGFTAIADAAYHYWEQTANTSYGHLAVITSIARTRGLGCAAAYSASKRYESTYLQALDQLCHTSGVSMHITEIRPGFVDTPLLNGNKNYPMLMSPDYVANRIVKAIDHRRRCVTIDSRWKIVVGLWHCIPGILWPHLSLSVK